MLPTLTVGEWESLRRELVWIRRGGIPAHYWDARYRPEDTIAAWRLLSGRGEFELPAGRFKLVPGQWIFPGKAGGRRRFSPDARVISIRFRVRWPGGHDLFDHNGPLLSNRPSGRKLDAAGFELVRYVQEELTPEGLLLPQAEADIHRYLKLRGYFECWLGAYVGFMISAGRMPIRAAALDPRTVEASRIIETKLRTGVVATERDLAKDVGLSLSHFKRLFVRDLKSTPKGWLDARRFEMAADRLREPRVSVKRIGYELGFRSPNHFSSWFRKRTGKTPGQFRGRATKAWKSA